jgi:hypothetical protein
MAAKRVHNEWFRPVSLGGRKSCPSCHCKLAPSESIWSHGEYLRAKWRTVSHFCKNCFEENVRSPLASHARDCGCSIEFRVQGYGTHPDWLVMDSCIAVANT